MMCDTTTPNKGAAAQHKFSNLTERKELELFTVTVFRDTNN